MGTTQPPAQYLFASSQNAVEAYSLSCRNHLANVERSLGDLLDQWLQVQNAERFGRTMLRLRRVDADLELLGQSFAARGRLLPPAPAILAAYPLPAIVHSLPPSTTAHPPFLLQGSAFAIEDQICLRAAPGFDVAIGLARDEFMSPTSSRLLPDPAPMLASSASNSGSIDNPLAIRREFRPTPLLTQPTTGSQPTRAHPRSGRIRFGYVRASPAKRLLRAGDFPVCAKIA